MKDKNKKDEQLNNLFGAYVGETERPPEKVTDSAKQYMQKKAVSVEACEPALAAEIGVTGKQPVRSVRNTTLIWVCAAFLLIGAILITFFLLHNNNDTLSLQKYSRIERSQLTESSMPYSKQEFLPFIEGDEVTVYKEYSLTEDVDLYKKGDVVLYYIEYTEQADTQARLYVETDNINFDELDSYKSLESYPQFENADFRVGTDFEDNLTYVHFLHDAYSYNLTLHTTLKASVEEILRNIDNSF